MYTNSNFNIGDCVVYPTHGVGRITDEEVQTVAGTEFRMLVITFEKDKMILRIPKNRAEKAGLRFVSSNERFNEAIIVLRSKAKANKGMWSKRAQEYEAKINSGNIESLAEVIRDLYRNAEDPGRSYSEKAIYDSALKRFITEYALIFGTSLEESEQVVLAILEDAKLAHAA